MSANGMYTTTAVVQAAAHAHGFTDIDAGAHNVFDELLFKYASGTIDAALLVAHGRKTIQPEDFASLAKLFDMFSRPMQSTSKLSKQSRQSGGTTNTGSYYSPGDIIDQTAYMFEGDARADGHGGSTTDTGYDMARSGLVHHDIAGGSSESRSRSRSRAKSHAWSIPVETVSRILREYRLRFNTDLRVTDSAKLYVRGTLQTNMDAVISRACTSKRSKSKGRSMILTAAALRRASDRHVLLLVLA